MNRTDLPGALRRFAELHVGPFGQTEFRGWPHAESSVWALGDPPEAFLKVFRQPRKFVQERRAYLEWLPTLDGTPTLMGESEALSALLVSAVPGRNIDDLSLTPADLLEAYRQAGVFLHSLHTLSFTDDDPLPLNEAFAARAKTWLARADGLVDAETVAWVEGRAAEAADLLRDMTPARVPCHRDYTARNWLVDRADGVKLLVIDFEHSRPDFWLFDSEKLVSEVGGTGLEAAFWRGYGGVPTDAERRVLRLYSILNALSTVVWARAHGDGAFEADGRRRLSELRRRH